jgi:hypothetical protein
VKDASGMMCDASVAIHWEVSSGYLSGMLDSLKWLTTRRRMFSLLSLICCIPIELEEGEDKLWCVPSKNGCSWLALSTKSLFVMMAFFSLEEYLTD